VSVFENRKAKLTEKLSQDSLDGMIVTNLTNVHYLSGFTGSAGTCLILSDESYFFSDGRYLTQSQKQVQGMEVFIDEDPHLRIIHKKKLIKNGLNLGFEAIHLSVAEMDKMRTLFPEVKFTSTTNLVEKIACVKDQGEIRNFRKAVEITDDVFDQILPQIREGVKEKEISAKISYAIKVLGGDGDAFDPIVAGGPNSALPHAVPGDREFQKGDFVVLDFGAKFQGYHADMTRTVVVGEASEKHEEIYNIVLKAQEKGIEAVKDGVSCKAIDYATRDFITEKGYGEYYIHSTGHGLGLEIHTMPRLSQSSEDTVYENYVITIEPGIYIPEFGGVRIEDDVVVGKNGAEVLNKAPKELFKVG